MKRCQIRAREPQSYSKFVRGKNSFGQLYYSEKTIFENYSSFGLRPNYLFLAQSVRQKYAIVGKKEREKKRKRRKKKKKRRKKGKIKEKKRKKKRKKKKRKEKLRNCGLRKVAGRRFLRPQRFRVANCSRQKASNRLIANII